MGLPLHTSFASCRHAPTRFASGTHDVQFQMVYVLRGWIRTEMDGHPAETMRVGSAWLQPPKIRHRVVDYSDDCEVLEVVVPADFETEMG